MSDNHIGELHPGQRVLLGPGPSELDPRVLRAMATPVIGHLDPDFLSIMNDTRDLIRSAFSTKNHLTLAMSGTGSAGMETCLVNLLEPGDKAVVCVNGAFGQRMVDIVERTGAQALVVQAPWGRIIDPADVEAALKQGGVKLVALVHVETSTGVMQPVEEIARLARAYDALVVLDAVSSLGGAPVLVDDWQVDAAYSGSQKCISAPPGLAPVTMNERARAAIGRRRTKVQSWYLDLTMIEHYWGEARAYHHTAPISNVYALREALRIAAAEGWPNRWERHRRLGRALQAGLEAMGLSLIAEERYRAPMVTAVRVPDGVDELKVRKQLLADYGLEIAGGLGEFKGRAWRIGLMGHSCQWKNVVLCLTALSSALRAQGYKASTDAALAAAEAARTQ
ncbi:MAG TPA: alanine--glyoxylate aminotransferase family protein [Limnochordales bacterium]